MSSTSTFPRTAFFLMLLSAAGFILATVPGLPQTVASHFGVGGAANGYMSRDGYQIFMLLFTLGLPALMVVVIGQLPARYTKLSNLPHKDYWFAPERKAGSLAFLRQHAYWFGSLMVFFAAALHALVLEANAQMPPRLAEIPFFIMMAVFLAGLSVWVVLLLRRFKKPGV